MPDSALGNAFEKAAGPSGSPANSLTAPTSGPGAAITDGGGLKLPLVYSCSGASSAAQMANYIAVKLDRLKVAEMSCIAGVGGDVKPLVRTAKSGRPIIVLDGCPLQCAAQILKRHGLQAEKHYDLSKMGVKKRYHEDFDPGQAGHLLERIQYEVTAVMNADAQPPCSKRHENT